MTAAGLVEVIKMAIGEREITLAENGRRAAKLDALLEASDIIAILLRVALNDTRLP